MPKEVKWRRFELVLSVAFILAVVAPVALGIYWGRLEPRWTPAVVHREVATLTGFEMLWTHSDVFMDLDYAAPFFAVNQWGFLSASFAVNEGASLIGLNLSDGQINWQRDDNVGAKVAHNSSYLFAGGQGQIFAFALDTGQLIWHRRTPNNMAVHHIHANEEEIGVDAAPNNYYRMSAETGYMRESTSPTQLRPYFYASNETAWFDLAGNSIEAIDIQTGDLIWRQTFSTIKQSPLLRQNIILLQNGTLGNVVALDAATGDFLWQSEEKIGSTIAASDSVAYFVTLQGELQAVNLFTGETLGKVVFAPGELVNVTDRGGFYVAASSGMVMVYLGDSCQLFAFRFTK